MSAFPSIHDLQDSDVPSSGVNPSLNIAGKGVEEQLRKKMGQVALKDKEAETARMARAVGYPHIDLEKFPITHEALRQIPEEQARDLGIVCFFSTPDELKVGALDPQAPGVEDAVYQIEERTHGEATVYLISQKSFDRALELYTTMPIVKPVSKDLEIKESDLEKVEVSVTDLHSLQDLLGEASATDSLVSILGAALRLEASDVHIEAEEKQIPVRVRLDGILHDAASMPKEKYKQLVSRIKLVSSLKINITDTPQDGRFTIKLSTGNVDVRVSTIPTVYGESIVMRLLSESQQGLTLESLGLRAEPYAVLKREIERPNGMVIATGPTGSGKTTTLYGIMQILNKPGVKIITLEDPVEYKMEGINQSQIDQSAGYTFAKGLRSMLRQDPDIAMVGEIRDLETADIAVQAALTGHLILSTVHTNNAAGAIPRFLSMGVKPFLLAPALNCVIGQRLLRRICESCKVKAELSADEMKRVKEIIAAMPVNAREEAEKKELIFYTGKGCEACSGIGYKGRVGIYEIFVVSDEIEKRILTGEFSEYDIERMAVEHGMVTMAQDGIIKALEGITSVDEVFRVAD